MPTTLEICIDSVASAIAAERGGADRVELCDNLYEGGTTPSLGLLNATLRHVSIPIHVMIRPRGGDFLYTPIEIEVMRADVCAVREAGAHGVVLGVLDESGRVDEPLLSELVRLAAPLPVTFHRAIDLSHDVVGAVDACVRCGVSRVLSSGGAPTAMEGCATLRRMHEAAAGRLSIAAGGGVTVDNCAELAALSMADELHGSLRTTRASAMRVRPPIPIPMGAEKRLTPESEYEVREADPHRVAAVVSKLQKMGSAATEDEAKQSGDQALVAAATRPRRRGPAATGVGIAAIAAAASLALVVLSSRARRA